MIKYVIMKKCLEYNDEYYEREDSGEPVSVVEDKNSAFVMAKKKSISACKNQSLFELGFNIEEINTLQLTKVNVILMKYWNKQEVKNDNGYIWDKDDYEPIIPHNVSDNDIWEILHIINMQDIYYVVEVED